jgi:hypothetical protein
VSQLRGNGDEETAELLWDVIYAVSILFHFFQEFRGV